MLQKVPYLLDPANLPAGYWLEYTTTDGQPVSFKDSNIFYSYYLNGKGVALSRTQITSFGGFSSGAERIYTCNLPESVSAIGNNAFAGCARMTSFVISERVTSIGDEAFAGCSDLETIVLNTLVPPTIHSTSFDGCDKLQIIIPSDEASVKAYLTGDWDSNNLQKIPYLLDPQYIPTGYLIEYTTIDGEPVEFVDNQYAFHINDNQRGIVVYRKEITSFNGIKSGAERLQTCILPESVSVLEERAFFDCSNLKNFTIPIKVSRIEEYTFAYSGLTDFIIHENIRYLGEGAFIGCNKLVNLEIKPGLQHIGFGSFQYCRGLTTLTLPDTVETLGENGCGAVFLSCEGLTSITLSESLIDLGDETFSFCSKLKSVVIPDGIKKIGHRVFLGCSSLVSVDIPSGVTEIDEYAFSGCSSLTSVDIPSGVTKIGEYAFSGCSKFNSIEFPEGVESIGQCVLEYCYDIQRITFPSTLKTLGKNILGDFYRLTEYRTTSIYCKAITPPQLNGYLLGTINSDQKPVVMVPSEVVENYRNARYWKNCSLQAFQF